MKPVVLFRRYKEIEDEYLVAQKYLPCYESRLDIKPNDLVIGRYSVLPYYEELEKDIVRIGARLINSYAQHRYVADIRNWYEDLKDYTPQTWFNPADVPADESGSFALKGETNSKKHLWKTHMFAEKREDVIKVYCNLLDDGLISTQNICIRKFVPLKTYFYGVNGLPITEEYRFFVYNRKVISGGFYWANMTEDLAERGIFPDVNNVPKDFVKDLAQLISTDINFFVMDIARTESGEWILIELNDGQMSGLSDNDADKLYGELSK